ncbi:hypothetical protein [Zavarzinella formosa]|uniref:hypothetical protein n=1 Tax=Zavarzinella formosa TaxID=360055 RepID=UPI000306DFAD|nr:hypothetical protein [Zavarzinella formosa]
MPSASQFQSRLCQTTVTIASSGTASGEADLGGTTLVGVMLPAALTGTTLTFTAAAIAGGTSNPVTGSNGSALSFTVAANKYLAIDPALFHGIQFIKAVSGSAEGASRDLILFSKAL